MNKFFQNRNKPYLIAEIGGNHQGDFNYAKKLLDLALNSQVDCIKFQLYSGENLVNKNLSPTRQKHFKKFELKKEEHIYLAQKCHENGVDYNSSVWGLDMLDWIDKYLHFYKIGSGDLTNYPLIKEFTKREKPIVLSTGLANFQEIDQTVSFIKKQQDFYKKPENLCIMQCTSMYPIPNAEANLNCINSFKKRYECLVGYSDHTVGIDGLLIASILGSDILEFHFTDNVNNRNFRDHQVSLTKDMVLELKSQIRRFNEFLGSPIKQPQESEIKNNHRKTFRRGVFPKIKIKKGTKIKSKYLVTLRPHEGTCASEFDTVVGSIALRDLEPLQKIELGVDFSNKNNVK